MSTRVRKVVTRHTLGVLKIVIFLLGALWTFYNAAIRMYPKATPFLDFAYSWAVVACVAIGVAWYCHKNKRLDSVELYKLGNNRNLTVRFGDISKEFRSRSDVNFVIPVNDYFDTELDTVVNRKTIHGLFLELCLEAHDLAAVNRLLSKNLKRFDGTTVQEKSDGKNVRYENDARVCLQLSENHHYLIAATQMNPTTLHAGSRWEEYPALITRICEFIREEGDGRITILPLIGDVFGRTGLPSDILLQQMIVSIWRSDRADHTIGSSLEIVLYDQDKEKFKLRDLREWSKESGLS